MGDKYVVFVDDQEVNGAIGLAAGTASFGIGGGPRSRAEELGLRRSLLDNLVPALTGAAAGDPAAVTSAMGSFALGVKDGTIDPAQAPPHRDGVQLLEGVNAIVIDEELADLDSLKSIHGIIVFENVELYIPEPVAEGPAVAAALASDWHLKKIGLQSPSSGGQGVLIGILDTGIDASHPEFAGKTIYFKEFDWFGNEVPGPARDAQDHGTHVSSIAAGARAGVAPGADLAVAAVLTKKGPKGMSGSLVQIVNGFNWLVATAFGDNDVGVDVVNASLGGAGFHPYLWPSVQSARQLGVLLLAAIGNSGGKGVGRHGSPGNYPEAVSVGATDDSDTVAGFSDWGIVAPPAGPKYPVPELCAPGVDVYAAVPGGGYALKSGTSMATPVVTGVAARRISANPALRKNPQALYVSLRSQLAPYGAHHLGNQGGAGRIIA